MYVFLHTHMYTVYPRRELGFTNCHVVCSWYPFQLEKLWQMFDFDRNGSLDDVEAEIMLECIVRG